MSEFKDIRFNCPHCEKHLVIDARGTGFVITCPDCQTQIIVPEQSDSLAQEHIEPPAKPKARSSVKPKVKSDFEAEPEAEFQGSRATLVSDNTMAALISGAFSNLPYNSGRSPEAHFVLETIQSVERPFIMRVTLTQAEERFGEGYRRDHLPEMLDLLLHFIDSCLDDGKITGPEIAALSVLRTLLDIEDGDLYSHRKEAVLRSLERQIDWIENDFQISHLEELYLVDLQRIFDLSYDQLLELAQPHVTEILDNLYLRLSIVETQDVRLQIDELLRVFCMLGYEPPESRKEEADEPSRRMIPKSVKNDVWRRDQGMCVLCGSQTNLEFDHIIPFSLGGSNTYRNIQLLCQDCNRSKAAHIG